MKQTLSGVMSVVGCVLALGLSACAGSPPECRGDADCGAGAQCVEGRCETLVPAEAVCGNGEREGDEVCDDGNATPADGCEPDCSPSPCGGSCASLDGACTRGVCNTETGLCEATPINEGDACEDADVCTSATTCQDGICAAGTPLDCDDDNPCTDDSCDPAGGCAHVANTGACDDGVYCNGADVCAGGTCSVHDGDPCAGGVECQSGCNEASDSCVQATGDSCTDDGNPCTADVCDANGVCTHVPVMDGIACDDGLFCNGAETCVAGACTGSTGDPCAGGGECADTCNEAADTCFLPANTACTSDANACTRDVCNGAGACTHPAAANGTACDDGLRCTVSDSCQSGVCAGGPSPCSTTCQTVCDEATGSCGNSPVGTSCSGAPNDVCFVAECDGSGSCGRPWNTEADRPLVPAVNYAAQVEPALDSSCGGCHGASHGWNFSESNAEAAYSCGAPAGYLPASGGSITASCWVWRTRPGGGMPQGGGTLSNRAELLDWYCSNHQ